MIIGIYLATFLSSICILLTLLIKHERSTNLVILFTIITTIQSLGRLIVASTNIKEVAGIGNMFIYIGGCFCPLVICVILNKLCKLNMPKWLMYTIGGYTVFVYALSLTIGYSPIYYKDFNIVQGENFNYLVKDYGPLHILFPIMVIMYVFIITFFLIYAVRKYRKVSLRTIKPIVILSTIILLAYVFEKIFKSNISYVSIGYFVAMLFCVHAVSHINMLDMPTNILNCIEKRSINGYIQFDEQKRCAGYNSKIVELFPEVENRWNIDEKIPKCDSFVYTEVIDWFYNHKIGDKKTIHVNGFFYELSIYEIPYGKKSCVGYILELFDRTAENKYLETVENYNNNLKKEVYEKTKDILQLNDAFGKAVDPNVRDYLLEGHVVLGGETRDVTVMFCDIRSFTRMSENMEPEKVVSMLNFYFTALGKCINKNHGIVNKYIGDAIMAIFGAPVPSDNTALDAYNAALDMRKALIKLNEKFKEKGWPELHFGIGINSGKALCGNIGATNRMEYTVIGDTVNTASRVESLCKEYKTDLLITQSTKNELGEIGDKLKLVDNAQIRGKEERVKLFN